jgi:hypothetical protein
MAGLLIEIPRQGCLIDRSIASLRKFSAGSAQQSILLPLPVSGSASTMPDMLFLVRKNLLVILVAGLLAASPALAGKPKSSDAGHTVAEKAPAAPQVAISKDAAVAMVRERTGGKVVRADRREKDGQVTYRVRVVTADGRVREYRVDAVTGEMY